MANEPFYKVIFQNQKEIYEIYARSIYQSDMWGFIEVEEFVFGERTQLVVKFPIRDAEGEIAGIGGIGTDITERKRAEAALALLAMALAVRDLIEGTGSARDSIRTLLLAVAVLIVAGVSLKRGVPPSTPHEGGESRQIGRAHV